MDERTDKPKAICPFNFFFQSWEHKKLKLIEKNKTLVNLPKMYSNPEISNSMSHFTAGYYQK